MMRDFPVMASNEVCASKFSRWRQTILLREDDFGDGMAVDEQLLHLS